MTTQRNLANAKRYKDTGLVVETTLEIRLFNEEGNLRDRTFINTELQGDASDPDFIPFDELTQEQVLQWTVDTIGEQNIVAKEQELIDREQARINAESEYPFATGLPGQDVLR